MIDDGDTWYLVDDGTEIRPFVVVELDESRPLAWEAYEALVRDLDEWIARAVLGKSET